MGVTLNLQVCAQYVPTTTHLLLLESSSPTHWQNMKLSPTKLFDFSWFNYLKPSDQTVNEWMAGREAQATWMHVAAGVSGSCHSIKEIPTENILIWGLVKQPLWTHKQQLLVWAPTSSPELRPISLLKLVTLATAKNCTLGLLGLQIIRSDCARSDRYQYSLSCKK
jgi:hypothetical protein